MTTTRRPSHRHLMLLLAIASGQPACVPRPGASGQSERPPPGTEAEQVFESLRAARERAGKRPPTWIGRLEPIARDGSLKLAGGGEVQVVLHEVNRRAAHNLMRNVMSWAFVTDALTLTDWPPRLLSDGSALVAIGVSLMQTTAPGRYAIVLILPESGSTPVSRP